MTGSKGIAEQFLGASACVSMVSCDLDDDGTHPFKGCMTLRFSGSFLPAPPEADISQLRIVENFLVEKVLSRLTDYDALLAERDRLAAVVEAYKSVSHDNR